MNQYINPYPKTCFRLTLIRYGKPFISVHFSGRDAPANFYFGQFLFLTCTNFIALISQNVIYVEILQSL